MSTVCGVAGRPGAALGSLTRAESAEVARLRVLLQAQQVEIASLKEELNARDSERDKVLMAQQSMQESIESLELEVSRLHAAGQVTSATNIWEERFYSEERARKAVEALKKASEEKLIELQAQIAELSSNIDKRVPPKPQHEEEHRFTRSDGPRVFAKRLETMKAGSKMKMWQQDKFQPVLVTLSDNCKTLSISTDVKKKPFETIAISDIDAVMYPGKTQVKKVKKNKELGVDYMKLSVVTFDGKYFNFLFSDTPTLKTWFLALRALTAKPGHRIPFSGDFLWAKIRSKLIVDAEEQGVNPNKMLTNMFLHVVAQNKVAPDAASSSQALGVTSIAEEANPAHDSPSSGDDAN